MASTTSAGDSANIQTNNNEMGDQDGKGNTTWTQFDEVDIDSKEYNNKLYYTVEM